MPNAGLFDSDDAIDKTYDEAYLNIRNASHESARVARKHCEKLWKYYNKYADDHFLVEIRSQFVSRYWEMYLCVALLKMGFEVTCPKNGGPDVGIMFNRRRIWFEATCPSDGAGSDKVPPLPCGNARLRPTEKIVLRYLSAIRDKLAQRRDWLKRGIISVEDFLIVAINPIKISGEIVDSNPPTILQAAYRIGAPYCEFEAGVSGAIGMGYTFRVKIEKSGGAEVPTGIFNDRGCSSLSGPLCSRVTATAHLDEFGTDFQFAPNPFGSPRLDDQFRLRGTYFKPVVSQEDSSIRITSE